VLLHLPNLFSLGRIAVIPFLLYSLAGDGGQTTPLALGLLSFAVLSDAADGFAARRLGQVSRLGQALDPIADKLFLGSLTFALVYWRGFPAWLVALLLARDLAIVAVGVFLYRRRNRVIPANLLGKSSTVVLCLALFAFLLSAAPLLRLILVWTTAALLVASSVSYARVFLTHMRHRDNTA
jgi:cardiolipin synthase (CMP-forming)